MRRLILCLCCVFVEVFKLYAQDSEDIKAIAFLLAEEPENISEDDVERLSVLLDKPVPINLAKYDELASCGIFTQFQVVSLLDYRKRSGPCLSFMELSALNGFGEEFVERVKPFISLQSMPDLEGRTSNEITMRVSARYSPCNLRYGYTARYKLKVGDAWNASLACSRSLDADDVTPDAICASIERRFRNLPLTLVLGDFNARFGQGLTLWSGSNFSSLNTPSAFMKRSFGITPSSSYTGNNVKTGMAAEYSVGKFAIAAFTALPGVKTFSSKPDKLKFEPAVNLSYMWSLGQLGITYVLDFAGLNTQLYIPQMKTSCDISMCVQGVDIFSEFVYDWVRTKPYGVAGVVWPVGDSGNMATMLKVLEEEYSIAASGRLKKKRFEGSIAGDFVLYSVPKTDSQLRSLQFKLHTQLQYELASSWSLNMRLTERIRSWGQIFRTDFRTDLAWKSDKFMLTYRFNVLQCKRVSWLTYIEGGFKDGKWSLYLRQGAFLADEWDDRIYAYERDVPGAYNVPALYGRGVWTSLMTSWKASDWCRLYLRAAVTTYPFMVENKPGKAELRFQSVFDF